MMTRKIKTWMERKLADRYITTEDAKDDEIDALRKYVEELEDFRDQVSELPSAFEVVDPMGFKPILLGSLTVALAIQDSIPTTKIIPLYSYKQNDQS